MRQRLRPRRQIGIGDVLERRGLLAAPVVAGNLGQVLQSQFQPYAFGTAVGTQLDAVRVAGHFRQHVVVPSPHQNSATSPINYGFINRSQFNGSGFPTIGLQLQEVRVGGRVTVHGSDNENALTPSSGLVAAAGRPFRVFKTVVNKGGIDRSQFNDGGFGTAEYDSDGNITVREGRVGLQWRQTRVRGSVDVGIDVDLIQPGGTPTSVSAAAAPGTTAIEPSTNTGRIRDTQFNDGGFGDIGMQWSQVAVGGRVATTSNTLFIRPRQDNTGPIDVVDRNLGQEDAATSSPASARAAREAARSATLRSAALRPASLRSATVHVAATVSAAEIPSTDNNSATSSGRLPGTQFNDGGFGDVGLQWKKVQVRGDVTVAHNSLTVQPENKGQGLITVRGINLPTAPGATAPTPRRPLPAPVTDPAAVTSDGDPVTALPTPTDPTSPYFATPFSEPGTVTLPFPGNLPLVNAATNSGLVRGGQFNAGGFGDDGLQWLNVRVDGHVNVVHNSLSVHPEGSQLAGIAVGNVAYGRPVGQQVARHLATIRSLVISAGTGGVETGPSPVAAAAVTPTRLLTPPNGRKIADQQVVTPGATDVFLQWNGIDHRRGLVVVHNIIKLTGVGPNTGPITLTNIRFPFKVPLGPLVATTPSAATVRALAIGPVLLNSAINSGTLDHAQFSSGGFGDDALQWRNVRVGGSVDVVHNTLAVDASADAPTTDVAGPITISNVSFNSGALRGDLSSRQTQVLVSPPDVFQRKATRPVNPGKALPDDPTVINQAVNSGIIRAGQFAQGAANHTLLQWQGVRTRGPVKVIDNVLSISVLDRPAGPISISNVTFA